MRSEVQVLLDPPSLRPKGALAQLGEHLLCKQGVIGSIPIRSTINVIRSLSASSDTFNSLITQTNFTSFREQNTRDVSFHVLSTGSLVVSNKFRKEQTFS